MSSRRFLSLLALLLAASLARAQPVTLGAIRWDDWWPGAPDIALLQPPAWHQRLPFHARRHEDGRIAMDGTLEHVLAAEAAYARAAGIDYFLFGLYPETGSWRRAPARHLALNRALVSFLDLPQRHGMRFAISLNQSFPPEDIADLQASLRDLLAHPAYLRTPAGAAPIFLFGHEPESWSRSMGTPEAFRTAFAALRAGLGTPVVTVLLHANPQRGAALARSLGLDMLSAYAIAPGAGGEQLPYAECLTRMRAQWRGQAASGLPMLPNLTLGWDDGPRIAAGRPSGTNRCTAPQPAEATAALQEALLAAAQPQDFQGVLLYAWNEYTEGGAIAPTQASGTSMLAALRAARGGPAMAELTLTWPDWAIAAPDCPLRSTPRPRDAVLAGCATPPAATPAWPCPPGMRPAADTLRAAAGMQALLHAGGWAQRRCRPQ